MTELLFVTPAAEQDIEGIGDYIANDSPANALRFIHALRTHFRKIADNPLGYRPRPELGEGIRSCAHGNYTIFFLTIGESVNIVRVLHGARDVRFGVSPDE